MVKFEKVSKYENVDFPLPVRKTSGSAGYDFSVIEDITIPSHYLQLIKMIKGRLTEPQLLEQLLKLEAVAKLAGVADIVDSMSEDEKREFSFGFIKEHLPKVLEFFEDAFTLDLDIMKALTKETGTKVTLVPTGVKVKLEENQKLDLLIRSSSPLHSYLMKANSVGLIDARNKIGVFKLG